MLNITGNAAIDVFIGLAFFYFLLSIVCSAINEAIATAFNLRAKDLERGIRNLLAEKTSDFYADPRIQALHKPKRFLGGLGIPWLSDPFHLRKPVLRLKKPLGGKLPSYISSRAFALTFLDTLAPPDVKGNSPETATGSRDLIKRAEEILGSNKDLNPTAARLLQDALDEARTDVDKFRAAIERSFDETMDRVSGWYKRRVQLILFVVALAAVGAINADSFTVAQRLWKNDALRSAVVAQANQAVKKGQPSCHATSPEAAAKCVDSVKQLGIPLGWSKDTSPSGWAIPGKMLGLLLTAFAILLGAPFWFDLLGKVSQLRGAGARTGGGAQATSGPPPATPAPPATVHITLSKDVGEVAQEEKSPEPNPGS
jgi:hypothetical protein